MDFCLLCFQGTIYKRSLVKRCSNGTAAGHSAQCCRIQPVRTFYFTPVRALRLIFHPSLRLVFHLSPRLLFRPSPRLVFALVVSPAPQLHIRTCCCTCCITSPSPFLQNPTTATILEIRNRIDITGCCVRIERSSWRFVI